MTVFPEIGFRASVLEKAMQTIDSVPSMSEAGRKGRKRGGGEVDSGEKRV